MNGGHYRLVKINFVIPKTQLSFQASPVSIRADTAELSVYQKVQTDRQTDGFPALYAMVISQDILLWTCANN